MKFINLTDNKQTIVDDWMYDYLAQFKWCVSARGSERAYAVRRKPGSKSSLLFMHREAFGYPLEGYDVDHIDGNRLNNSISNLRFVTRVQNNGNARKPSHGKSSRFKGVSKLKNRAKYEAYISKNDKKVILGYFTNEIEAAKAYNKAAQEYFALFFNLDTPCVS